MGVRAPLPGDVEFLAEHLGQADRVTVSSVGLTPSAALRQAMHDSVEVWVGEVRGVPVALYGVARAHALGGFTPWFLATDAIPSLPLLRESRRIVRRWHTEYGRLEGFCPAANTATIRWLRWLGFELSEPIIAGPWSRPFHQFVMEA